VAAWAVVLVPPKGDRRADDHRQDDLIPPLDVSFEVWKPITGSYEPMASLDHGLTHQGELAEQVRMMWV